MKFSKQELQYQTPNLPTSHLSPASSLRYTSSNSIDRLKNISRSEYFIPVLVAISLIVSCMIYSSKKYFWNDELFSYFFLSDPLFSHMWSAFHDKLNNTPPLYFLLGWGWSRLFGASELSLRLFSCLGLVVASWFTWFTLRRTYGFWPSSLAVLVVFCLSTMVLSQNAEARMYGLYLAVAAAGVWLYDLINRRTQLDWKILLLNALIQAAIVNTHLFGCLYSGAIVTAFLINDFYYKHYRYRLYASFLLGWLTFILYIPAFLIQADAGNPRNWIPLPSFRYLIDVLCFTAFTYYHLTKFALVKAVLLMIAALIPGIILFKYNAAVSLAVKNAGERSLDDQAARRLLLLAYLFLAVPIAVWIFSVTVKPAFWDRYLLPSVLSWPILFASLFSLLTLNLFNYQAYLKKVGIYNFLYSKKLLIGLVGLMLLLLFFPVYDSLKALPQQKPGLKDNIIGYEHLPVVVLFSHDFMERMQYSAQKERYHMILDWEVAVDSTSGLIAPQFHKHLEAWKRSYPDIFAENISTTEEFLSRHKQFLVLGFPWECDIEKKLSNGFCDRWLYMRVMNDPKFKIITLGDIDYRRFYLVESQ